MRQKFANFSERTSTHKLKTTVAKSSQVSGRTPGMKSYDTQSKALPFQVTADTHAIAFCNPIQVRLCSARGHPSSSDITPLSKSSQVSGNAVVVQFLHMRISPSFSKCGEQELQGIFFAVLFKSAFLARGQLISSFSTLQQVLSSLWKGIHHGV
jgi:hypothetical protein